MIEFADRRMLETQIKRVKQLTKCTFVAGENDFHFQMKAELDEYFAGELQKFETPIILKGTKFQEQVWNQLTKIAHGKTRSYDWISKKINNAGAQRAVGKANGDNRFAIVVPCHRVIRSDGTLSGYGGGVWRKRWLLDHEQATMNS
jgi:AraC family transcriptional regulator of adaptative response/methylated-DNA-[protein]-cysteine methyltransferase